MSQQHIEKFTCPKCNATMEFTVWDSINTELNPELKDKVMDESLFLSSCPKCGHTAYITFGTLYHDPENQFMIFFDHAVQNDDISEDRFPDNDLFSQFNRNYKLRYVHGIRNLKEKIFLFEEGISDVAVELIKYFLRNGIIALKDVPANWFIGKDVYFTHLSEDGETLVFTVIDENGKVGSQFGVNMDIYEQCLQKLVLDKRFAEEGNTVKNVCYAWVDAKLKTPLENEKSDLS